MYRKPVLFLSLATIAAILGCVTLQLFTEARSSERQIQQLAFERQFQQRAFSVEQRLKLDAAQLRDLASFHMASERVTQEEFESFVSSFSDPGHISRITLLKAGSSSCQIEYQYPKTGPQESYDFNLDPAMAPVLTAARNQGVTKTSEVHDLSAFGITGRGVVTVVPIYESVHAAATSDSRRGGVVAYGALVYELNRFMLGAIHNPPLTPGLRLKMVDVPANGDSPQLVFAKPAEPLAKPVFAQAYDMDLGGRQWRLVLQGDNTFYPMSAWTSLVLLIFGITATAGVTALWYMAQAQRLRVKKQVRSHKEDIERNRLELEQTLAALREANDELLSADRAKTEFLSTVSHELRTPLTVIQEYVELILSGKAPRIEGEAKEFLEVTRHQLTRLKRLVGDLLDFARLESNSLSIRRRFVQPEDVLARLREFYVPVARGRGIVLQFSLEGNLTRIWTDPDRLEQILGNLLSNALKFTPRGQGVRIHASATGNAVVFLVEDDGPGMKAEEAALIFKRFQRLSNAESVDGTGLGLAIAQGLTSLLGGSIDLNTSLGQGSCFRVEFPVYTASEIIENEVRTLENRNPESPTVQALRASVPEEHLAELEDWLRSHVREFHSISVLRIEDDPSILILSAGEETLLESIQVNSRAVFSMIRWDTDTFPLLHAA